MKFAPTGLLTALVVLLLSACETETRPVRPHQIPGEQPTPSPTPDVNASPSPSPMATPEVSPTPASSPAASPTPTPGTTGNLPYGIPVPGKPGFVMSPFSQSGYVDVRGFPPNTEVKDPYSGRSFLVP